MILGLGVDLCDATRIERAYTRFGGLFIRRICHPLEADKVANLPLAKRLRRLAQIFAAKEAASKALGTGFRHPVGFHSFVLTNQASGRPVLLLKGAASEWFDRDHKDYVFHITLSDDANLVIAVVVLEKLGHS